VADTPTENLQARIIAVVNQKGGTGKTTTACNLAASLATHKQGLNVAIIDLDPQGASTTHLTGDKAYDNGSYDVVVLGQPLTSAAYTTSLNNCDLIPATNHLILSEMELASRSMSFEAMALHLKDPEHGYDVIVIDCPAGFGMISTLVMTIADLVVIPTLPQFFALHALRETISYLNGLRSSGGVTTAVLLTMYEKSNSQQVETAKKIRRDWGELVVSFEIPKEATVEEAAMAGKLLLEQSPGSVSAKAYKRLAISLGHRLGLIDEAPVVGTPEIEDKPEAVASAPPSSEEKPVLPQPEPQERLKQRAETDRRSGEGRPGEKLAAALDTPAEKPAPAPSPAPPPPPAGKRRAISAFTKTFLSVLLLFTTAVVIYLAIQADMLAWVVLAYLILILLFFPVLIFLLV